MSAPLNYKHLYYFWVVGTEGGVSRAAEKLGIAVQTVSTQVRELERALGCALLKPAGRGLVLTEAGRVAMEQANHIFQLGERLPAQVRDAATTPAIRLSIGISDGLPKLVVRRLLQPVMHTPHLRLVCHEGDFDDLRGDLALHRLDLVLSDRPAPTSPNLKLYSHAMGSSSVAWYGTAHWAQHITRLPHDLAQVPLLLPTQHTAIRAHLDTWLQQHGIYPRIAGEFEDSALLKTFGASGMGVFPMAECIEDDLLAHYAVQRLGPCEGVTEQFFAIGTEKKVQHPLVQRLLMQKL